MLILGIETSCDDTGVAIIETPDKKQGSFKILSNVVSSQIKVHAKYGGVVPNLAAREHLKNIEPCLKQALNDLEVAPLSIDLIAVTVGPGLIPCLLVGTNFAKALAYCLKKPIIGVNHIEGHIVAALAATSPKSPAYQQAGKILNPKSLPAIALVVSGGHTQLVLVKKIGDYKIIGETRDDAAGECFDKIAKLLGLGYPGGPVIAACAAESRIMNHESRIELPRPMMNQKNYDFSFSGLKTAVLYTIKNNEQRTMNSEFIQEICAESQQAIIDVLIDKTIRAAKEYKVKTIILSGGVAANKELRNQLKTQSSLLKTKFLTPVKNLCTDNGAMIALAGYLNYKSGVKTDWKKIKADANLRLG